MKKSGKRTILLRYAVVIALILLFSATIMSKVLDTSVFTAEKWNEKAKEILDKRTVIYPERGNILASDGSVLATNLNFYTLRIDYRTEQFAEDSLRKHVGELATALAKEFPPKTATQWRDMLLKPLSKPKDKRTRSFRLLANLSHADVQKVKQMPFFNNLGRTRSGLCVETIRRRTNPYGEMARRSVGRVGQTAECSEVHGISGLERALDSLLYGVPGVAEKKALTHGIVNWAKTEAVPGYDVVTTIDINMQDIVENELNSILSYVQADWGVAVLMDVETGDIKAISNLEKNPLGGNYIEAMNRAVLGYEPGSVVKTLSMLIALEEGVVSESDHFYCSGSAMVEGWSKPIGCSKTTGHGDQTLAQAVANSCNPAFIAIGQKLGAEKFYDYLEDFGFLEPTNIDMQGEPTGGGQIIWSRENFTNVNLATASFGQRFQVTPLQLITAASSVVNGGHLMQPYVVSQITDADGNVLQHTEPTEVRQVISEQTSERCREILEKVVDGGTGKNAAVEGYRIGGKTGSSETTEDDHTIVSFLGFAPADDPQVVILLAYDNPKPAYPGANTTADGWYISGGNMAAIKAGELLEKILDYLGVEKSYSETADVMVPNLTGLNVADATSALKKNNLSIRVVGDGDTVTGQIPANGASIPGGSEVVVYMGAEVPTDQVTVPNLDGLSMDQAKQKLSALGLYLKATGATEYGANLVAYDQSIAAGTSVDRGTTIEVRFTDSTASGAGL